LIPLLYFCLIGIACFLALRDWRLGILLMLVVGGLQDPVRKLMPGTPGWMVLSFMPVWLAICINLFKGGNWPWVPVARAYPRLQPAMNLLLASLFLALLVLLFKHGTGSWLVGVIGLIGYVFPLLAIAAGFHFARNEHDLLRFMKVYCSTTAVLLLGGLFEKWKIFPDWAAVGTGVLGTTWIRHVPGYIVELTAGFFRSPDLQGWHAALLVMFGLLLVLRIRNPMHRAAWLALVAWGAVILLISGRNKMIFMPMIFMAILGLAYVYKGNTARALSSVIAGASGLMLVLALNQQLNIDPEYLMYTQKGAEEAVQRIEGHGIGAVITTYKQSGFFGEGLGTASTGARYGGKTARIWQESGSSKLMVELGAIGLIAALLFAFAMLSSLFRLLRRIPRSAPGLLLFAGFLGILMANAASFTVSHQAFGDPYLVTLAGFFIGVAFSAPRWVLGPEQQ
jgi:hypothetical protein